MTTADEGTPIFHVLLRRDPAEVLDSHPHPRRFRQAFVALRNMGFWPRRVRLYTDTDELSAAYSRELGVPFTTLPVPFNQHILDDALARRTPSVGAPLVVGYLGDARTEKGYHHLPELVDSLYELAIAGLVRFVFQSNFNIENGEPGISEARDRLARYARRHVELLCEPLETDAYYAALADMDIVIIPYDANRYSRRSSGVFTQAIAARKVVVVPHGTSMAARLRDLGISPSFTYGEPAELAGTVARAMEEFSAAQQAMANVTLARDAADQLLRVLMDEATSAAAMPSSPPLVLHIIDGDANFFRCGTAVTQNNQRGYLRRCGYRIATVYVVRIALEDHEFDQWINRAWDFLEQEGIAYVWLSYFDGIIPSYIPDLLANLDLNARLQVPMSLLDFLAFNQPHFIFFNYITNLPFVQNLGISPSVRRICEIHDIQSYQYAIYQNRTINPDELAHEARLITAVDAAVSVNAIETFKLKEIEPSVNLYTVTPAYSVTGLSVADLAGCQDLGEVLSSAQSKVDFVDFQTAWSTGKSWQLEQLFQEGCIDLLYVSSWHRPNQMSFDWFLDHVFGPHLHQHGVTVLLAGNIGEQAWAEERRQRFPKSLFLTGKVEDLRPLYAAARVVILPIVSGAGVSMKSIEAFCYGKPVVATSLALRGLRDETFTLQSNDNPAELAARILELLRDRVKRQEVARECWDIGRRRRSSALYDEALHRAVQSALGHDALAPTSVRATETFSFVEWNADIKALNRTLRQCVLDTVPEFELHTIFAARIGEEAYRTALLEVVDALFVSRSAHLLKTRQLQEDLQFPRFVGGHVGGVLAKLFISGYGRNSVHPTPPFVGSGAVLKHELAVCLQPPIKMEDPFLIASLHRAFMHFYHNEYLPNLAPLGVRLLVTGLSSPLPTRVSTVTLADVQPEDLAGVLKTAGIILLPGDPGLVCRPSWVEAALWQLLLGAIVLAAPESLWFLPTDQVASMRYADNPIPTSQIAKLCQQFSQRHRIVRRQRDELRQVLDDLVGPVHPVVVRLGELLSEHLTPETAEIQSNEYTGDPGKQERADQHGGVTQRRRLPSSETIVAERAGRTPAPHRKLNFTRRRNSSKKVG
jgi:glycosyltransferase involved in cell wall biosynthesis